MKDTATVGGTINHLKRHYFGNIIILAGLFLLTLFRMIPYPVNILPVVTTLEQTAVMITLIVIPTALKLFADRLKKIPRPSPMEEAAKKYKKLSYLRLYLISGTTLMNIVLFGLTRNPNFLWFTGILFVVFLFCKPSYIELTSLSDPSATDQRIRKELKERPEDEEMAGK